MKRYDISQELLGSRVFPGDPAPEREDVQRLDKGDMYNLSYIRMCAHNGTHVDAPSHFIRDGKTIEELSLKPFIGMAYVAEHQGIVTGKDAEAILRKARMKDGSPVRRILIKGKAEVSLEAAEVFAASDILLFGNESQTVGPEDAPMPVHLKLLGANIILLEGIRLGAVPDGVYLLNAAPLNIAGAEGAPCRAVLIDMD